MYLFKKEVSSGNKNLDRNNDEQPFQASPLATPWQAGFGERPFGTQGAASFQASPLATP